MLENKSLNLREAINKTIDYAEKEKYSDFEILLLLKDFIEKSLDGKLGQSVPIN